MGRKRRKLGEIVEAVTKETEKRMLEHVGWPPGHPPDWHTIAHLLFDEMEFRPDHKTAIVELDQGSLIQIEFPAEDMEEVVQKLEAMAFAAPWVIVPRHYRVSAVPGLPPVQPLSVAGLISAVEENKSATTDQTTPTT